jgi:hypothetical protein
MIEFKQNMGKRIYIQRKRMSYGEYGFTKRSEVQSSYQEYSCKPREEKEQSYQEYGDPKMSGTCSLFGSQPAPVDLAAFDDEMERYCEQQRKIKAERLAKRTAYCDEHDIQGDIREKILKGRISIEEFEALQKSASEVTEAPEGKQEPVVLTEEFFHPSVEFTNAPEQPAEEPVEVQTDVTTAEPETVPEQTQTGKKKKSKKNTENTEKTEEVSDAE